MLSFKQFLNLYEELNSRQKSVVRHWAGSLHSDDDKVSSAMAEQISKHIIPPGRHHLIIPVSHPETHRAVEDHLKPHGIDIVDYERGLGKDSYGRDVKLGKALVKTKAPKELVDKFASLERSPLKDHEIIVSRHPYHVAEASTGKKWKSCVEMTPSGERLKDAGKKLHAEVGEGTHVAYLVKKLTPKTAHHDLQTRIDKADARVYLKPHTSQESGHTVLVPEKVYGTSSHAPEEFKSAVENFCKEHFPMNGGEIYRKNSKVYDDNGKHIAFNNSANSVKSLIHRLDYHEKNNLLSNQPLDRGTISSVLDHLIKTDGEDSPNLIDSIARRRDLSPNHIDRILEYHKNTPNPNRHQLNPLHVAYNKALSPSHVHKLLDHALDEQKQLKSHLKKRNINYEDVMHNDHHITTYLNKLFNVEKLDKSHYDKAIQLDRPIVHRALADYGLFSPEQLDKLEKKYKGYEPRGYVDNVHAGIKANREYHETNV